MHVVWEWSMNLTSLQDFRISKNRLSYLFKLRDIFPEIDKTHPEISKVMEEEGWLIIKNK